MPGKVGAQPDSENDVSDHRDDDESRRQMNAEKTGVR